MEGVQIIKLNLLPMSMPCEMELGILSNYIMQVSTCKHMPIGSKHLTSKTQ